MHTDSLGLHYGSFMRLGIGLLCRLFLRSPAHQSECGARLPAGRCMRLSGMEHGLARAACLSLFFVCAISFVVAQEPVGANEVASGNTIAIAAPETNEGITYNIPLVPEEPQKNDTTATPISGAGLHGSFFERLAQFYWADWAGK